MSDICVCICVCIYLCVCVCVCVQRLDDTAKSNFAGGDTHWEEEKLGLYANR